MYEIVCIILRLAILVQCRIVTDGWTCRWTDTTTAYDAIWYIYMHSNADVMASTWHRNTKISKN